MVTSFQKYVQSFGQDTAALDTFLDCDLLIIDDLGSEPVIKNVTQEHIYNIINERIVNELPFIITTNLSPIDILDRYDQRIAGRITSQKNSARIEFKGGDLRRTK
jgi:DNA replication protein DnaC